ncbi:MAG TPA: benzoate-CoA ligase family protein [Longimicrobium sp.]|jgi:2-aminobenzoate-CoA ligase|uniref:benzoate-CoA ligase family protein n=1 Tax=Longimicrobium sp. TaxID=2029185 RepID=UPI002ED7B18B
MATMETHVPAEPSAHVDTFARDHLPPRHLWPEMDYSTLPELAYPPRLNCAVELLDRMVEVGHAERTAILWDGGRWSYRELMEKSNRVAAALHELGLVPGNRVLLRGPNSPMMAACWFGVLKAGGVVVATMPLLRPRELAHIAQKAMVRFALCDHRLLADLAAARGQAPVLERVVAWGGEGDDSLDALMERQTGEFGAVDTAADDVALIAFTSGTTGQPKGAMHFHRDVLAACDCFPKYVLKPTPDDVFCGSPPLAFTFGLGGILLFPLRVGAAALLIEQPTPPNLLKAIQDHGATIVSTAPTAYRAMLDLLPQYDLRSLTRCVSAGENLPLPTFEAWEAATGIRIIDGIGSTEMLHIFISASDDDIRPGSTGKAVPGYRARIIDEDGNPLPPGSIGRLAVQGPTGCRYLDDEERQRGYVWEGWNLTGDAYRMDEDGYFWYQARTDDMIVSAGYNIAGPEVEAVLLEHPAVMECGVVGLPDAERGQVVSAFVVLREGHQRGDAMAKELQQWVKDHIAPYKYPRRVTFLDQLPRTQTGKLQRFRLREGA